MDRFIIIRHFSYIGEIKKINKWISRDLNNTIKALDQWPIDICKIENLTDSLNW